MYEQPEIINVYIHSSFLTKQEGSLFGHGYDPVTGDFKGAVSQLTYTGSRGNDTFLNDWVHPTLNSVHTLPDQVRPYPLDLGTRRKPTNHSFLCCFLVFRLFCFVNVHIGPEKPFAL